MFFGEAAAPRQALHSRKPGQRMFSRRHPAASKASVPPACRPRADNAPQRRHARGPKEGASPPPRPSNSAKAPQPPGGGTPHPRVSTVMMPSSARARGAAPAARGSSKTGPGPMHADSQTPQALIATLQRRTRTRRENAKLDQPKKMGCTPTQTHPCVGNNLCARRRSATPAAARANLRVALRTRRAGCFFGNRSTAEALCEI